MTPAELLQRAFAAHEVPTLYILGKGGRARAGAGSTDARTRRGCPIDAGQELEKMRPERPAVQAGYGQGLEQSGFPMASLPELACDCLGFVTWAQGLARDGAPGSKAWFDTNLDHKDALGSQLVFRQGAKATPGVLHCAPENDVLPPPAGLPNNAKAETGPEQFQADARSRCVTWKGFDG